MAETDGAAGGPLTGELVGVAERTPDEDAVPHGSNEVDEVESSLGPNRSNPRAGAARSTNCVASTELPYSWVPSRKPCWGTKEAGRREFPWLTQSMDWDMYLEWDPAAPSEWSRTQVRTGAWAPERGAVAWWQERDAMRLEIHFLRRNIELLLARIEAAEWDRQGPPLLPPPPPPEGERPAPAPPNDEVSGQPGPSGPPGPQPPQALQQQRRLKASFDGTMEKLTDFLVPVEVHMERRSSDYVDEGEQRRRSGIAGVCRSCRHHRMGDCPCPHPPNNVPPGLPGPLGPPGPGPPWTRRRRRVQLLEQQSRPQARDPAASFSSFSGVFRERRGEGRGNQEPRGEVLAPDGIGPTSSTVQGGKQQRSGLMLARCQAPLKGAKSTMQAGVSHEQAGSALVVSAIPQPYRELRRVFEETEGDKPKMNSIHIRFRPEASGVQCVGVEGEGNRQPEVFPACVTLQEPAVQMGSMAVIGRQRVGGKDAIPQGQRLWAGEMGGKPWSRGQPIQVGGPMGMASDLPPIDMELRKGTLYKHCGQMYVKLPCEVDVKLMDLVGLHVSFKKCNGKICVLTHEKGSGNPQESGFCDGVGEDDLLCEQRGEKGSTPAASPAEEQQEGMCETTLPEGSPEQSVDALSEWPLPNCSVLVGEGNVTEGWKDAIPQGLDSDLQQEPEVSEKPSTAGYLEMQAGPLKESVDFPQGDAIVTTQPVKAVCIDLADPVTAKSSSFPLQAKGDGGKVHRGFFWPDMHKDLLEFCENCDVCEKVDFPQGDTTVITQLVASVCVNAEGEKFSVDADYRYAVGWSDVQKLQQHQFNVICSDFKDVCYFDTESKVKQSVGRDMLRMLHLGATRKKTSKWRDATVVSPEKKVSDYGRKEHESCSSRLKSIALLISLKVCISLKLCFVLT
uniref:Uncharacterized protein n=1 Tax=Sphaerodactylus townsendi TaxID=933632 RepID=A0ACB8E677_9SAUR